ncbi:MAG: hypothetical protein OXG35_32620 [Acidobacteria bacterium]|nr:hypothetical protein [Acidobacteriota bacterium]
MPRSLHFAPIAGWNTKHCVYPDEHGSTLRQLAGTLQQRLQIPAGALLSPDAAIPQVRRMNGSLPLVLAPIGGNEKTGVVTT